jgi:lipoprotein-releasing system permease protein
VSYFIYRTNKSLKVLLSDIFFVVCFWKSLNHLSLFLWLRYLRKKKIVFLSIAAVALSVSLLIVVASLFTGFINAFKNTAVEAIGNVVIAPPRSFSKYDQLIENLEQTDIIDAATAKISGYGLLHLGMGNVRAVEIWGIEPGRRSKVTGFDNFLLVQKNSGSKATFNIPDSPEEIGGFVGIGVIDKPDEETDEYDVEAAKKMLGEKITLTTGITSETDNAARAEIKRKVLNFTIRDIVETGVYQFDTACIYLSIEQLSETLHPDEELPVADQIHIKLAENTDSEVALTVIRGIWRNFVEEQLEADPYLMQTTDIETAQQMQSRFIAAYLQQMNVLLVIFGIVSFGVVLLVFCIFYLIVRLKQKDIAIVKSCGAASASVASIFICFGACVGVIGSGIGVALGYVITRNINVIEQWIRVVFGLKLWRSSVYMFSRIPDEVNWSWALCIVLMAIIAATIGSLIPAVIAAITKPVEILRYE